VLSEPVVAPGRGSALLPTEGDRSGLCASQAPTAAGTNVCSSLGVARELGRL